MSERHAPPAWRLPYDELATAVKGLPGWVLHASGLSMSRELGFASSGPALLFVQAAGLLARLERRWPEISWAKERVWVTLRSFEVGLTWRDLELARKLEALAERCAAAALPEPPLPPGSFADFEELVEATFLALRGLYTQLGEERGSDRPGPLRAALEDLPDWEPEVDGEGLTTEFELPSESQAEGFLGLAREIVEREGWRVELAAAGRFVGAVVYPSDVRGLSQQEIAAARVLEQLYGNRRPAPPAPVSSASAPAEGRQAKRRLSAALEELRHLAAVLDRGQAAKERLAQGQLEAAYFEHAGTLLARDLKALSDTGFALRAPTAGDLEAFAAAFPADSATYLVHGAAGALRSAASLLEAAGARYEGLLLGSPEHEGLPGRLLAALTLRRALADYLRPALDLLGELDNPGALPPAVGWAAGPWQALDGAARQTSDLAERLLAAFESLAEDELATEPGAGLALALSSSIAALQSASREASRARDGLERPALAGFSRSKRLALRLAGMARLAGGWQEELRSVADQLDLERVEAGLEPDLPLRSWLEGQADGPLAEVAATLSSLATSVPPDPQPRVDQVS